MGFYCERELETEHKLIFWPQTYSRHVVSFLFFDAQPEVQRPFCLVMAFFTASYQHLLRTSTHQGPKAPSAWCGFPYHISSPTGWNSTGNSTGPLGIEIGWNRNSIQLARQTQLSYLIVRRPLDLWNRMFNRHQAEIAVMQFRGHSLPVHHSVVYHGNFF